MPPHDQPAGHAPAQRIGILRALQLGDLLCAVPALRAVRAAQPHSEISLIGLPWASEFACRYAAYIDRFIEFPGYPGLPERRPQLDRIPGFLAAMQRERFDLVIQLHGSGRYVNEIVSLLGARKVAGFFSPGDWRPDSATFMPWPNSGLEVHRLLALVEFLGFSSRGDDLDFPLTPADFAALTEDCRTGGLAPQQYAVVHPGASVPERRWPLSCFAKVADDLASRGLRIVLTGTAGEQSLAAGVAARMQHCVENLAGRTRLGHLAALVAQAALVVCNDTGVSHLAAALRTPSVVVSTGDQPQRWAPGNCILHRVLCPAQDVTPADALTAAWQLLAGAAPRCPASVDTSSEPILLAT